MFCKKCGSENPDGAKFCRKCGSSLAAGESSGTQGQQTYGGNSGTQGQQTYGGNSGTQGQQTYGGQQTPPPYTPPYQHKMTIEDLPQEYRPIGMWGYFGYSLLFNIPFAGWIIQCESEKLCKGLFLRTYRSAGIIVPSFYGGLLSSGNDVTEQVKKCFVKIVEQS